MSHIKVKDKDNWVRDSETGAIICLNVEARNEALAARNKQKQKEGRINEAIARVDQLSDKVSNIEKMLERMMTMISQK